MSRETAARVDWVLAVVAEVVVLGLLPTTTRLTVAMHRGHGKTAQLHRRNTQWINGIMRMTSSCVMFMPMRGKLYLF